MLFKKQKVYLQNPILLEEINIYVYLFHLFQKSIFQTEINYKNIRSIVN